jgi:hypothetical protein
MAHICCILCRTELRVQSLNAFSMFILIVYSLFILCNLHRTLFLLLCVGVKNNNLASQQAISVYQKVKSQSIFMLYNFKSPHVGEAYISLQKHLGVKRYNIHICTRGEQPNLLCKLLLKTLNIPANAITQV